MTILIEDVIAGGIVEDLVSLAASSGGHVNATRHNCLCALEAVLEADPEHLVLYSIAEGNEGSLMERMYIRLLPRSRNFDLAQAACGELQTQRITKAS